LADIAARDNDGIFWAGGVYADKVMIPMIYLAWITEKCRGLSW